MLEQQPEIIAPLTENEKSRLAQLEKSLHLHLNNAAAALLEISESKLYRESHGTMAEYVKDVFGQSQTWANRLINQEQVNRRLKAAGSEVELNANQAYTLSMLLPEQQLQVVEHASKHHESLSARILANTRDNILCEGPPVERKSEPRKPNKWITPPCIARAARAVMGGIDLDPASDTQANATVEASKYYTAREDGLSLPWFGRVLLHAPSAKWDQFMDKLLDEMNVGNVTEAVVVCPADTSEVWWQRARWEASVWYSEPRLALISSNTHRPAHNPMHDMCVMYLGHNHDAFASVFQESMKAGSRVYCGIVAAPIAV